MIYCLLELKGMGSLLILKKIHMHMSVYVCVCTHIHTYTHIHRYTHTYITPNIFTDSTKYFHPVFPLIKEMPLNINNVTMTEWSRPMIPKNIN